MTLHAHFINENIGGHATMHRHLLGALNDEHDIEGTIFDVPRDVFAARLVGAAVPGLGRLDLDLHLIRARLAQSAIVQRHLRRLERVPDVLHAYTQNTVLLSREYLRRVPTIVSIDATNRQNAYRMPQRRPTRFTPLAVAAGERWERAVFAQSAAIVAHSRWAADSVLGYGIPAKRIEVIPFGIDVPAELPPRAAADGLPRVVFVGSSMERKGGWRLLRIWERHLQGVVRLVFVTPEPVPVRPGIEVHRDVRPGNGRLDEILLGSDVFVMPGEIDAFGYAIIEAMAFELPVVAVAQAAVPELVAGGATGLLVPPGDDVALAHAIGELAGDEATRKQFGRAGRARVRELFDARVTTGALVEVIRSVAA